MGCDAVGDDDLSRALLGSSSLFLSLRAGASPSHSALFVFSGKWEFEGKIETEINLHPFKGQLKSISGKYIFRAQPNTRKYGKAFPEMLFTQNKHSLRYQLIFGIDKVQTVVLFFNNKKLYQLS